MRHIYAAAAGNLLVNVIAMFFDDTGKAASAVIAVFIVLGVGTAMHLLEQRLTKNG